jgi:hypothetical protein
VLVTHQSTDELRAKLKEKLQRLSARVTPDNVEDAQVIDVDAELGFEGKKADA